MALMFQRLAYNFAKNGYYPTDDATTSRILDALEPSPGPMRILDPCCGEGVALAECKHHLGERAEAFGVEYDAERAYHAKKLLDHVIHADITDTLIGAGQFGLLFLNPPYGDGASDHINGGKRTRLEKEFYKRTVPLLQIGGVFVFIVPSYSLDEELCNLISRHFDRVAVFAAPEQRFKQAVVFGVRKRASAPIKSVASMLHSNAGNPVELPKVWMDRPYTIPATNNAGQYKFSLIRLDRTQLEHEMRNLTGLTRQFKSTFGFSATVHRRPVRTLSSWHQALSLAAGQAQGIVKSNDGSRTLLIKGDTYKDKRRTIQVDTDENGNSIESSVLTDIFVPVIRAIDFTHGPQYGSIITIK